MLEEQYNPEQIESSIQSEWENTNKYKTAPDDREKYYCLSMFPYPCLLYTSPSPRDDR